MHLALSVFKSTANERRLKYEYSFKGATFLYMFEKQL